MDMKDMKRPMEGGIRVNRQAEAMMEEQYDEDTTQETTARVPRRTSRGPWVLVITIAVVILVGGFIFRDQLFGAGATPKMEKNFQAVFLTNGQVYFGKLSQVTERYARLENIYYLQVTPVLQTRTPESAEQGPTQEQQQQLSLVKLGNELHGPVDSMYINRDQILFFEDLKDDGNVVQAIKEYEDNQK